MLHGVHGARSAGAQHGICGAHSDAVRAGVRVLRARVRDDERVPADVRPVVRLQALEGPRLIRFRPIAPHCVPVRATAGSAGIDLRAYATTTLEPGDRVAVRTGLHVAIPEGHVGLVRGRSGLAFKHDVWAFEGTIDADYRGELAALLWNVGTETVVLHQGERIAQLVVVPFASAFECVEDLGETGRGTAGFGSTGR